MRAVRHSMKESFVQHILFCRRLSGGKKGVRLPASLTKGCPIWEVPERRSQNPQGGASRSRSPLCRQRLGVFPVSLCPREAEQKRC